MRSKISRVIALMLIFAVIFTTASNFSYAAKNYCTQTIYDIKQVSETEFSFKVSSDLATQIEYSVCNSESVSFFGKEVSSSKPFLKGYGSPGSTVKCKVPVVGKYYILVKTKPFSKTTEVFKTSVALQKTTYSKWIIWDKKTIAKNYVKHAVMNISSGLVVAAITFNPVGATLEGTLALAGGTAVVSSTVDYIISSGAFTCSNIPTSPALDWKWRFRYVPDKKKDGFNIYLEVKEPTGEDAYCNNEKIGYIKTAW